MTKSETAKIIAILSQLYPKEVPATTIEDKVTVWHMILEDSDYSEISRAVISWERTSANGFCPKPGQLIQKAVDMRKTDDLDVNEAWALVKRAASNSLYNSAEEFEKLPAPVKILVGNAGQIKIWAGMTEQELDGYARWNFEKDYQAFCGKQREQRCLEQGKNSPPSALPADNIAKR